MNNDWVILEIFRYMIVTVLLLLFQTPCDLSGTVDLVVTELTAKLSTTTAKLSTAVREIGQVCSEFG